MLNTDEIDPRAREPVSANTAIGEERSSDEGRGDVATAPEPAGRGAGGPGSLLAQAARRPCGYFVQPLASARPRAIPDTRIARLQGTSVTVKWAISGTVGGR